MRKPRLKSDRNGMNSLIREQNMQEERAGIRENFRVTIGTQCTENLQEMMAVTLLITPSKGESDLAIFIARKAAL